MKKQQIYYLRCACRKKGYRVERGGTTVYVPPEHHFEEFPSEVKKLVAEANFKIQFQLVSFILLCFIFSGCSKNEHSGPASCNIEGTYVYYPNPRDPGADTLTFYDGIVSHRGTFHKVYKYRMTVKNDNQYLIINEIPESKTGRYEQFIDFWPGCDGFSADQFAWYQRDRENIFYHKKKWKRVK